MSKKALLIAGAMLFVASAWVFAGSQSETASSAVDTSALESPMLSEMVASGALPPLEERIPANPMVMDWGEPGRYGGAFRVMVRDPSESDVDAGATVGGNALAQRTPTGEFVPNIAESWDLTDDFRSIEITLREGIRWSDGVPLTTEDVRFWWEDVILNKELTPSVPAHYTVSGEVNGLEIVDDYTFRILFAHPFPLVLDKLASGGTWSYFGMPKHFLKQFHIKYNEDANDIAKKEGYGSWAELFLIKSDGSQRIHDVNLPVLSNYILEEVDPTGVTYFVRNPYLWKVDGQGRQLPYIDRAEFHYAENLEVLKGRALSGDATYVGWYIQLPDYALFKENEETGGYTAGLYQEARSSEFGFAFNYTHTDPVLNELFNDLRFRQAMSYAIDRDEMNELLYFGRGTPRQPIADPSATFYKDGIDQHAIEYDVDKANNLLDEIGLEWDSRKEFRKLSDGRTLQLRLEIWDRFEQFPEFLVKYWKAVGVDLTVKFLDKGLYQEKLRANELMIGGWAIGGGSETYARQNKPIRWQPPFHWPATTPLGGTLWYAWYESNGASGVEPPEIVQHLYDLIDAYLAEPFGTDRYLELGAEILQINADNLWLLGTIGLTPRVAIVDSKIRNGLEDGDMLSIETGMWAVAPLELWWFDE